MQLILKKINRPYSINTVITFTKKVSMNDLISKYCLVGQYQSVGCAKVSTETRYDEKT